MALRTKKEKVNEVIETADNEAIEVEAADNKVSKSKIGRSKTTKDETSEYKVPESKILVSAPKALMSRNEIRITGTVVNLFKVPNQQTVVLSVATNAGGGALSNYPKITFYGSQSGVVYEALGSGRNAPKHPQVTITGSVQTTKRLKDGEFVYYQTAVGDSLSFAATRLETILNTDAGKRAVNDENEVILIGEIVHVYRFERKNAGTILTIKTTSNSRIDFPKVTLFRDLNDLSQEMEIGDHVALIGMLQTKISKKDGKQVRHENIVATDLDWYRE